MNEISNIKHCLNQSYLCLVTEQTNEQASKQANCEKLKD
jgi:hypothetical protein